jgi:hypothetical protein
MEIDPHERSRFRDSVGEIVPEGTLNGERANEKIGSRAGPGKTTRR